MHASIEPTRPGPSLGLGRQVVIGLGRLSAQQIPDELLADPETARRARLITHFGTLGSLFGIVYAGFYVAIDHFIGAMIVAASTLGVTLTPALMRATRSIPPAGNFFSLVLVLGFLGLCLCEGGLNGHAIAWLVSIPLCATLLLGARAAVPWIIIALLAASFVAAFALAGVELRPTYDPRWHVLVSTAGYLGLIAFMAALGLIFEQGRRRAFAGMQQAVQELAESNQRLVELNAEKNDFLGIAAHDLKNPLTSILMQGELLRGAGDPRLVKYADKIIASAEAMRNLVTDLLDVNAIEEGRFASNLEPCELAGLVQAGIESNLPQALHKRIQVLAGSMIPTAVRTDATAARQILDNLISNAVKYSPHGATVRVELVECDDQAHIRVCDQGPGLSEEDQKNLFKKYCKLSAKPTGGESSNGLGLAIAQRLAQALGGDIRCESQLGAGSTFILVLPLPPKEERAQVNAAVLPEPVTPNAVVSFPTAAAENAPRARHAVPPPPAPMLRNVAA